MVSKVFLRILQLLWILTLGLMGLGALTRAKKAGLACPDWPLCFGQLIPDYHPAVYFEFIHRAMAGSVSILFVGCLVYVLRSRAMSSAVKNLMIFAAVDLFGQIIFGALTVRLSVQVDTVTTHLALATVFFGCLLWVWMSLSEINHPSSPSAAVSPRGFCLAARFLPALIFCQLLLGGLVANSYAGSVCVDFPTCNGQWIPTLLGPIGLQVMHRFGAYTVFIVVMAFALYVGKHRFQNWVTPRLRSATWWLVLAVLMQVSLGITNVLMLIPAWLTVLHHLFGILLFAASLRFVFATFATGPNVNGPLANRAVRPGPRV